MPFDDVGSLRLFRNCWSAGKCSTWKQFWAMCGGIHRVSPWATALNRRFLKLGMRRRLGDCGVRHSGSDQTLGTRERSGDEDGYGKRHRLSSTERLGGAWTSWNHAQEQRYGALQHDSGEKSCDRCQERRGA
nr:hypothetical protein CFP56_21652 [Quercus suber]